MTTNDYLMLLAAAIMAAPIVLAVWPDDPEHTVLGRIAKGDSSPDIFIGIPDRVVEQFTIYAPPVEVWADSMCQSAFVSQVRQSAIQTLERRHASR